MRLCHANKPTVLITGKGRRNSLAMFEGLFGAVLKSPKNSWGEAFAYCCSQFFQKMLVLHRVIMNRSIKGVPAPALTFRTTSSPP
jgi:hypothetical protein